MKAYHLLPLGLLMLAMGALLEEVVLGGQQARARKESYVAERNPITISPTATPACDPERDYTYTQASFGRIGFNADMVPGSNCNECVVSVPLPITFVMYGQPFTGVLLGDNGTLDFVANPNQPDNTCLPGAGFNYAILSYWDDLTTDFEGGGIFTTYDAGLHSFAMEWRARKGSDPVNFEITLYETTGRIELIYGSVSGSGSEATAGVQRGGVRLTQFSCNAPALFPGLLLTFTQPPCSTGTPSVTGTRTPTPTFTFTRTRTPTPALTATPSLTPTPDSAPILVGHVTWQGPPPQPDARQQLPISLTLRSGASEVEYPPQTTDASGFFSYTVASLPPGEYEWRVKGPKYLANCGMVTLGVQSTEYRVPSGLNSGPALGTRYSILDTQVEMGLMRAGDANNDNVVNAVDFTILKGTFGKSMGDPGYDDRADFNGDQIVNTTDFTLLRSNFASSGCP